MTKRWELKLSKPKLKFSSWGTSLAVQWLRLCFPMQGGRVPSLIWELRSHKPQGVAKIKNKQTHYKSMIRSDQSLSRVQLFATP